MAALSLDVHTELTGTIDVLEDCYFTDVHIGQAPVEKYAHTLAARLGAAASPDDQFLPERHQIAFAQAPAADDSEEVIQRLTYRADLPYRKEYSAIRYPAELNRRPGWLAAVGPYVSVLGGHPDFIENSIFLSAVQAVAAAAQLRAIRHAAYADVRLFRDLEAAGGEPPRRAAGPWSRSPASSATWNWSCPAASKRPPTWACSSRRCGPKAPATRCRSR